MMKMRPQLPSQLLLVLWRVVVRMQGFYAHIQCSVIRSYIAFLVLFSFWHKCPCLAPLVGGQMRLALGAARFIPSHLPGQKVNLPEVMS
ncbi:hypothetical protein BD414DRAFT_478814 [Trametes punicea]|nr:hypothetical protein BD414DRAFT_478814 [Trametes punicea]